MLSDLLYKENNDLQMHIFFVISILYIWLKIVICVYEIFK